MQEKSLQQKQPQRYSTVPTGTETSWLTMMHNPLAMYASSLWCLFKTIFRQQENINFELIAFEKSHNIGYNYNEIIEKMT